MNHSDQPRVWQVSSILLANRNFEMLLDMSDCNEISYFLEKFNWPIYSIVRSDSDENCQLNYPVIIFHDLTQEMYDYWEKQDYAYVYKQEGCVSWFKTHDHVKSCVIPLEEIWENSSVIWDDINDAYEDINSVPLRSNSNY